MKITKFEDVVAWQKSGGLTMKIYDYLNDCSDYGFKNQITRASVSIMNNIAEGFERMSNKELKYFLFISKGSCAEVRSMLYLAVKLKYINNSQFLESYNLSLEISKLLSGFIKKL